MILEVSGYKLNFNLTYFFIFFEFFVICLYFYLVYIVKVYKFFYFLFFWGIFWIIFFLLNSLKIENQLYDIETYFVVDFFGNEIGKKKPKIEFNGSIKEYKENIKLLAYFMLYEEEGIVWNKYVMDYLENIKKGLVEQNEYYKNFYISLGKQSRMMSVYINLQNLKLSQEEL